MPIALSHFIATYGYVAIFSLVFFQEIGVPNPVPNEIVLIFSGSLGATGVLSFPLVFLVVVSADILGALLLYGVFYRYGQALLSKIPLPVSHAKIERLTHAIARRGWWGVFLGRLLPFLRGYASVVAGITRIRFTTFLYSVVGSALVWSGGFAVVGKILGSYWIRAESAVRHIELIAALALGGVIVLLVLRSRKHSKPTK